MQDACLKEEILARYASVHAFCKAHPELKRGVVYQTVSGKYAGNRQRQAARIRQALAENTDADNQIRPIQQAEKTVTREQLTELLENIRCANCRRLNRRECLACKAQTTVEASQLFDSLYARD